MQSQREAIRQAYEHNLRLQERCAAFEVPFDEVRYGKKILEELRSEPKKKPALTSAWSKAGVRPPFGREASRFPRSRIDSCPAPSLFKKRHAVLHEEASYRKNMGKIRNKKAGWAEYELFKNCPSFRIQSILMDREEEERQMGPGRYDIEKPIGSERSFCTRGMLATRRRRFKYVIDNNPPPGTYGWQGTTDQQYQRAASKYKDNVLTWQKAPLKREQKTVGCRLAPNLYVKEDLLQKFLDMKISALGPYKTFTTDRTKVLHGHYKIPPPDPKIGPGYYNYSYLDVCDQWFERHNNFKGRFPKPEMKLSAEDYEGLDVPVRYQEKPKVPGLRHYYELPIYPPLNKNPAPCDYETIRPRKVRPNKTPFLVSGGRSKWQIIRTPGPGRYDINRFYESCHRNGHTYLFVQKQPEEVPTEEESRRSSKEEVEVAEPAPEEHEQRES